MNIRQAIATLTTSLTLVLRGSIKEYDEALSVVIKAAQQSDWIPCERSLPNKSGEYLITIKGHTKLAYWSNNSWWGIGEKRRWTGVTAWMERPEAYKEEP